MKKVSLLLLGMLLMPFLVNAQKTNSYIENLLKSYSTESDTAIVTRGVSYSYFKSTVSGIPNNQYSKKLPLLSWTLWKKKLWGKLDTLFTQNNLNNNYPPNFGATSEEIDIILPKGWLVDRYGSDYGVFLAPIDIPLEQRSLNKDSAQKKPYKKYIVLKDIHVKLGQSIPWDGYKGLGVQFRLTDGQIIETLKKDGYIEDYIIEEKP
jgi:hypothetical protein